MMYFSGLMMGMLLSGLAVLFVGSKRADQKEIAQEQLKISNQRAETMWREDMYLEAVAMTTHNEQLDRMLARQIADKNSKKGALRNESR